jgi:hypothetical protein
LSVTCNRNRLSVTDFETRLRDHFFMDGAMGGALFPLMEGELKNGMEHTSAYVGFHKLNDAAQGFMYETLRCITGQIVQLSSTHVAQYSFAFVDLLMIYKKLRSASILSTRSYPGPAFSILRDVAERSILLSSLFQGLLTYNDLMGFRADDNPNGTQQELNVRRRKHRKSIEQKALTNFFGPKSGLSLIAQDQMSKWKDFFDQEIHGSYLSSSHAIVDWHNPETGMTFLDSPSSPMAMMCLNRQYEVSWMFLRLLPNLQNIAFNFDTHWQEQWRVLDDSFWQFSVSLSDLEKPIGAAFIEFIDSKFPFSASSTRAARTGQKD